MVKKRFGIPSKRFDDQAGCRGGGFFGGADTIDLG
jgi:hypothetical protein